MSTLMKWFGGTAAAALVAIACGSAEAAIIYTDATDGVAGNTAIAASAGGGVWTTNGADAVDGIWRLRGGFGLSPTDVALPVAAVPNGGTGTIYESAGSSSGTDNVPRVVTTKGGLAAGTYNVYAYFWDDGGSPWRIRAGLTDAAGDLPLFSAGGVPAGSPVPTQVGTDAANRRLWQASLGQVTGTSVSVFVEDAPATTGNERTWYDGIGIEAVPEPTSLALLGMAIPACLLAMRRRSKA